MSCVICSPALPAAGPPRSGRARWLWLAMSIFMPRPAARRPGRWATSRSAIRLAGLPGRLVRRRTLVAGPVPRLTVPGTADHVLPPDREAQPGAPGGALGSRVVHADHGGVAAGSSIGTVNVWLGRVAVRSAYRKQVQRIAPSALVGREAELRELAAYCTEPGRSPYVWWQAPAWAGKSALMSTFVLHPPAGVRVVAFFITARLGGQDTREAFTEVVLEQLAELLGTRPAVVDGRYPGRPPARDAGAGRRGLRRAG